MMPLIGVTIEIDENKVHVNKDYMQSIIQAGGIPLAIPFLTDNIALEQLVEKLDGLLLTGGEDVDPELYGEDPHRSLGKIVPERDDLEMRVLQLFLERNKPVFAICRGQQLLNVAFGGDLYQDLLSQLPSCINHDQKAPRGYPYHFITIDKASQLYQLLRTEKIKVNTYHHQAAKIVRYPLVISAVSNDGVIEAVESRSHDYVLGVQWHPEGMAEDHDPYAEKLFSSFIEACQRKTKGKVIP